MPPFSSRLRWTSVKRVIIQILFLCSSTRGTPPPPPPPIFKEGMFLQSEARAENTWPGSSESTTVITARSYRLHMAIGTKHSSCVNHGNTMSSLSSVLQPFAFCLSQEENLYPGMCLHKPKTELPCA